MKHYRVRYKDERGSLVWGYVLAPDHRSAYLHATKLFEGRLAVFEPRPVLPDKVKPSYPTYEVSSGEDKATNPV